MGKANIGTDSGRDFVRCDFRLRSPIPNDHRLVVLIAHRYKILRLRRQRLQKARNLHIKYLATCQRERLKLPRRRPGTCVPPRQPLRSHCPPPKHEPSVPGHSAIFAKIDYCLQYTTVWTEGGEFLFWQ